MKGSLEKGGNVFKNVQLPSVCNSTTYKSNVSMTRPWKKVIQSRRKGYLESNFLQFILDFSLPRVVKCATLFLLSTAASACCAKASTSIPKRAARSLTLICDARLWNHSLPPVVWLSLSNNCLRSAYPTVTHRTRGAHTLTSSRKEDIIASYFASNSCLCECNKNEFCTWNCCNFHSKWCACNSCCSRIYA